MILHRVQGQAGLLVELPDGRLPGLLPRLHQPRGQLIDVAPDGIAVLPNQHHPVLVIQGKNHHPVRRILPGDGFQRFGIAVPGGHVVVKSRPIPPPGLQLIKT